MAISPFVFSSDNLPRQKAKQLASIFPFLKLSAAQEATARALGYPSWHECTKQGKNGKPSPPDQDAGLSVRIQRYYHQAGVLQGLGITPDDADLWVRAWGLTGEPTLAPDKAIPYFYRWNSILTWMEKGVVTEEQVIAFSQDLANKYLEVDRPERICPGVILGPLGKYPHYAVDPVINARIPIYLRGARSMYHCEEDPAVLAATIPGFATTLQDQGEFKLNLNPLHHEWHYGTKHPNSSQPLIPLLEATALALPDAMVVISMRAMPDDDDRPTRGHCALACLRGSDFAVFVRAKGAIDPEKVVWYTNINERTNRTTFVNLHPEEDWAMHFELPVFKDAKKFTPSQPLYSYPFKRAPMEMEEFTTVYERFPLLPLNQDFDENWGDDDSEDDWDDDEPDDGPDGPTPRESALQE